MMSSDLPLPPNPRTPRGRRARDLAVMAGLIALFLAGVAGLFAATGWEETRAQVARLTFWQGAALLALAFATWADSHRCTWPRTTLCTACALTPNASPSARRDSPRA